MIHKTRILLALWFLLCGASAELTAQVDFGADLFPEFTLGGADNPADAQQEPVVWSARYSMDEQGSMVLHVEAKLSPTWHVYSVTQPGGGPTRTTIEIVGPEGVALLKDFRPDQPPKKSKSDLYGDLVIEEHEDVVVWSAPVAAPDGFDGSISIKVKGLVCKSGGDNRCMPTSADLVADYSASDNTAATSPNAEISFEGLPAFRDGDYVVQWKGVVQPTKIAAGQQATLHFQASPELTFHVYESVVDDSDSSTNFVITEKSGLLVGAPIANKEAVSNALLPTLEVRYYEGEVVWSLPVEVPEGTEAGEKLIKGMIAYQACTESSCRQPMALEFATTFVIGNDGQVEAGPIEFATARRGEALDAAASIAWVDDVSLRLAESSNGDVNTAEPATPEDSDPDKLAAGGETGSGGSGSTAQASASASDSSPPSLLSLLGLALIGGLILNVMPCVLPVVGLKVMGFIQQAGEDRGRIAALNFAYVGGIMFVFTIFAIVASVTKFGWGEQFTFFEVKYTMTILTFSFALSYLGVWELPALSMGSGQKARELESREGLMGAFSKGIYATILATPCSGPLLGYVMGVTYELSAGYTFLIFVSLGLGMSLPYILLGLRPSFVSWLPKPGEWMNKVKEFMAFLFLGTVAFFFGQFSDTEKLPVFVSLIAVWFGFWITAQVESYRSLKARLSAWVTGAVAAIGISLLAFASLRPVEVVDWTDYTEPGLQQLKSQGRTVMLDFGATWCLTCKYNYKTALNTAETRKVIDELDAVAMYADWSDYSDEIKLKLEELNSRSIPLLVIYPGDRPDQPIILRDIVTQSQVIEALRQAGPSVDRKVASRMKEEVQPTPARPGLDPVSQRFSLSSSRENDIAERSLTRNGLLTHSTTGLGL